MHQGDFFYLGRGRDNYFFGEKYTPAVTDTHLNLNFRGSSLTFSLKTIFSIFQIKMVLSGTRPDSTKNQFWEFILKGIGLDKDVCALRSERSSKMLKLLFNQLEHSSSNGVVFTAQVVCGACTISSTKCYCIVKISLFSVVT